MELKKSHLKNIVYTIQHYPQTFIKTIQRDDVQFRLITMLKLTLLTLLPFILLFLLLSLFYKLNILYFISIDQQHAEILQGTFSDFIYQKITRYFLPSILLLGSLMFVSLYIADLMIRPFRTISVYCERKINGDFENCFDPLFYADLKLLNYFGNIFFTHLENCQEKKILMSSKIPKKFLQIHKPVLEQSFFIHFSVWIIFTSILTIVLFNIIATEVHTGLVDYYLDMSRNLKIEQNIFIMGEKELFNSVLWSIIVVYVIASFLLVSHLYSQVSKPAFAFFSTMRSFMKGNYKTRVHMLGYYFIREHSRNFNKYLDFLCRELKNEYDNKK